MKSNKRILVIGLIFILSFQVQVYAASDTIQSKQQEKSQIEEMVKFILNNYVGTGIDEQTLIDGAMKGMFDTLDKYSEYYSKEELNSFSEDVSGEYAGIGVRVKENEKFIEILEIFDNSPAKEMDIRVGDMIIEVANHSMEDMTFKEGLRLIKGIPGTTVDIKINRNNEVIKKTVERRIIKMSAVTDMPINEKLSNAEADNIRYIKISQFNANVASDMKAALQRAKNQKAEGLLIDLRDNPGGYLDQVVKICQALVPSGPIVHIAYKSGKVKTYDSTLEKSEFKIVVLVNENSASASEIMTGAIKDSAVGVIVGEKTYGKGVVQKIFKSGPENGFKMTIAEYLTRNKTHINKVGIEPDVKVEVPNFITNNNLSWQLDSEGENVIEIENILLYLGYKRDKADNLYDEKTVKAIEKFQEDNELTINGIADFNVQVKLNDKLLENISKKDIQLESGSEKLKELIK